MEDHSLVELHERARPPRHRAGLDAGRVYDDLDEPSGEYAGHLDDDDHQDDDGHGWWPETPAAPVPAVQNRFDSRTSGNVAAKAIESRRMNRRPARPPVVTGQTFDFSARQEPARRRASDYSWPMQDGFVY